MKTIIGIRTILISVLALLVEIALLMIHTSYGGGTLFDDQLTATWIDILLSFLISLTAVVIIITPLTLAYRHYLSPQETPDYKNEYRILRRIGSDRELQLLLGASSLLFLAFGLDFLMRGDNSLVITIPYSLLYFFYAFF